MYWALMTRPCVISGMILHLSRISVPHWYCSEDGGGAGVTEVSAKQLYAEPV